MSEAPLKPSPVRARMGVAAPSGPRGPRLARHALAQLTVVRFLEFVREPEALFWVFVFPLLLAAGLGLAFRNRPPEVLKIAAVTPHLVASLKQEQLLDVQRLSVSAAERALREGKVALVVMPDPRIHIAHGYDMSKDMLGVVYEYDDTNPEGRTARMLADRAIWGMGFTIVDARRKKLMKRLVATPMPRHHYLLSFALSRLLLLVAEVGVLTGFGALVFHVPLRGSLVDLGVLCVLGSMSFGAIGLLIASRVQTIEAASGIMNVVMMPMWIVSGVFFSAQRFPDMLQPVIKVLPLTAIIDALRANMLQG